MTIEEEILLCNEEILRNLVENRGYDIQILEVLGNIQAYMIFILAVLLAYFVYKFFRMFF